jgi:hypothetical protein
MLSIGIHPLVDVTSSHVKGFTPDFGFMFDPAFKDSGKEDFKKRNKAGGKNITLYVSSCLFLFYL